MWVFLPGAFVSIVAHRERPAHVLVRARRREDLDRFLDVVGVMKLGPRIGPPIEETLDADYRFRAVLTKSHAASLLMNHALAIDYDNFKAHPANLARHGMLMSVWLTVRGWADVRKLEDEYTVEFK